MKDSSVPHKIKNKILVIIPARGGSKEVPNKNIKKLKGIPLIVYTIREVLKLKKYYYKFIVSTDSKKIARISHKAGACVPFIRPKKLALDTTSTLPVLRHALRYIENKDNINIDWVLTLQATNPLTKANDIKKCIRLINKNIDSIVSVREGNECHPMYLNIKKGKYLKPFQKNIKFIRRQDINPTIYKFNGSIFLSKRKIILNSKDNTFFGGKMLPYIMPKERSFDIDSAFDFNLVKLIMKK